MVSVSGDLPISNFKRKHLTRTPEASPLNIVTHLKLKATAGTKQSERSLYSKNKPNVQSKEKTGATDLKAAKEKIVKTYLQVSLFSFLQKMK
jgi:hypothetical protein